MKWVTRWQIHVNRTATAWLIRRFLDPQAEILFIAPGEVAGVQEREGAIGFDAPGARYPHSDERGRCSFEQLVDERLGQDPALARLARIVHGADFPAEIDMTPESAGLWAISQGFTDVETDDERIVERASFLYDSLYAHLRREAGTV
ncbi:MAG: chromate resistance protein ChrB domain-containing protein [Thermoanaerobaculia bacterium]